MPGPIRRNVPQVVTPPKPAQPSAAPAQPAANQPVDSFEKPLASALKTSRPTQAGTLIFSWRRAHIAAKGIPEDGKK
jgi:hypothetical protein